MMSKKNVMHQHVIFFSQRSEIIYAMADLLTEKRDEILSANKKDMELAVDSGTLGHPIYWINPNVKAKI